MTQPGYSAPMKRGLADFCRGVVAIGLLMIDPVWAADSITCRGMCDASAVATIGTNWFVAADDEQTVVRAYSRTRGDAPVFTLELTSFLRVERKSPEVDIEGAASVGDRVYWISSHARNPQGKARPNRQRFFATTIALSNGTPAITPFGHPYARLLDDLIAEPGLKQFDLSAASQLPPESKGALNIEALGAGPDGSLLIGFRNPIPHHQALLVPLLNPDDLILKNGRARFGMPILLDLGGLGIRGMAGGPNNYWIIAGPHHGREPSRLYEWTAGAALPRAVECPALNGFNAEAVDVLGTNADGTVRLLLLSDDGKRPIEGEQCKAVKDPALKYFRAVTVDVNGR